MLDAVIAVITNGEKVLFIQRAPNIRGGGHWAPLTYCAIHQCSLKVPRVETFSQTFRIGRTVKPTSSIASRATAASWLSPASTSPLTGRSP
jgi:hypothetical protein